MFGDVSVLLDNPERVADTWLNLASAIFFYVYPQPPKPSMLHVIDGTWIPGNSDIAEGRVRGTGGVNTPVTNGGFGVTTLIINGGVECGGSAEHIQSQNRIKYYREFSQYFGLDIPSSEVLGCKNMPSFKSSAGNRIFWENDWSYISGNPGGGSSYACKLVSYQTAYSAFKPGDYQRCVEYFYPDVDIQ